ncbi:PQQ-binding-like beta-propeller repeat protein [Pseudonocardia sp.]|uniref:outer membrane protein assembly factor BamB family protein n=1 Tax=Pseudonocardia sp. TaxID=60912 RepID=UPI003D0E18F6
MSPIPRGVVDDARLAAVHDRAGQVIALDPTTGAVRWRRGHGLRPCAITAGTVLAVAVAGASGTSGPTLTVVALAEDDGRELWSARLAELPEWARPGLDDSAEFTLAAQPRGEAVVLWWRASATYRGGAAADPERVAAHTREATGAVRVDAATRSVQPVAVPPVDEPGAGSTVPTAVPAGVPAVPADVVEVADTEALRVELAVVDEGPGAVEAVVLRGVDRASGDRRWEVTLDQAPRRGPPPLRP